MLIIMCVCSLRSGAVEPTCTSSMADRPAKLARLQSIRSRLPYISQSALSALLQLAANEPIPDASSRSDIRAARDMSVHRATPYGATHQTITVAGIGGPVQLEVQHPLAMLYYCCTLSSSLSKFIGQLAAAIPPTIDRPWRLILYTDEVLPGNQLGYKSARKFWAVYWSIYEFGSSVVSDEVVAQYLHTCPLYCDILFGSGCGLQPLHFCQPLYTQCNTHVCNHCKGFMV
jgi:hypothetical protein